MNVPFKIDESSLPPGWGVAQINQIAEIVRGVTYKKADAKEVSAIGLLPILRATNIQDSTLVLDRDLVFVSAELVSESQVLRLGDIVVATSSGSKHLVGKTAQVKSEWEGSFGAFCAVIRPNNEIQPRYLGYFFESPAYKSYISAKAMGVNINNLRRGDLEEITVPIAPIEQQKRIVAEIEKQFSRLDEAVANLKRVKANLKRYKAAVLKAAVEGKLTEEWRKQHPDVEPADKLLERILAERREKWTGKGKYKEPVAPDTCNLPILPEGWVWASLDQLTRLVTSGSRGWGNSYSEIGSLFIRAQDIKTDSLILENAARVSVSGSAEGTRSSVSNDDILVTITGANVTKSALVKGLEERAFVSQHVALLRPCISSISVFLYYWIVSPANGRRQLENLAYGAGKPGLSLEQIRSLPVALPPLTEQQQIVAEVERRLSIVAEAEAQGVANLRRADRLRQSILKKVFSGQLVQQDSNDEPVRVLLERIRTTQHAQTKEPSVLPRKRRTPAPKSGAPAPKSLPLVAETTTAYGAAIAVRILAAMQPGREYARADLVEPLGLTTGQWNAAIQELKRQGKVRQVGEKGGARYLIACEPLKETKKWL